MNESHNYHFKMDTTQITVFKVMRFSCFMASGHSKDAYYTVPVLSEHKKFLNCVWEQEYYQFICLSNGTCTTRYLYN